MASVTETIQVSGIRCEKCVMRLAKALEGADGLEAANATLMGQVTLSYDDERTSREALLEAMSRGGFREALRLSRESQGLEGALERLVGWLSDERQRTDSLRWPPARATGA